MELSKEELVLIREGLELALKESIYKYGTTQPNGKDETPKTQPIRDLIERIQIEVAA
jgi:hypothetical protein